MKPLSADTPLHVEGILLEGYRRKSPGPKLERVWAMNRFVERMQMADVRRRYPDATERERRLRPDSRWMDPEWMRTIFDWDFGEKSS